jgi:hypothetical protein
LPSVVCASKSGAVSLIARAITHLRRMGVIGYGRLQYRGSRSRQPECSMIAARYEIVCCNVSRPKRRNERPQRAQRKNLAMIPSTVTWRFVAPVPGIAAGARRPEALLRRRSRKRVVISCFHNLVARGHPKAQVDGRASGLPYSTASRKRHNSSVRPFATTSLLHRGISPARGETPAVPSLVADYVGREQSRTIPRYSKGFLRAATSSPHAGP